MSQTKSWLVYFDVPDNEVSYVTSLGAKYCQHNKKWYFHGNADEVVKFKKWLLGESDEIFVAGSIYIIESKKLCWNCNKETPIIGLGISEYIHIYRGEKEICTHMCMNPQMIRLAWVDSEQEIPPALLRYIKMHYPVRNGYSNSAGNCFANHCSHCGKIQGNFYIFSEPDDSPLIFASSSEADIKETAKNIKIKRVLCNACLALTWNIQTSPTDKYYTEHCFISNISIWDYGLSCLYEEMYQSDMEQQLTKREQILQEKEEILNAKEQKLNNQERRLYSLEADLSKKKAELNSPEAKCVSPTEQLTFWEKINNFFK